MTPTFIDDIAFAMKYLFENFSTDIFHIVGTDSLSPYDAGKFIANAFNLDQKSVAIAKKLELERQADASR